MASEKNRTPSNKGDAETLRFLVNPAYQTCLNAVAPQSTTPDTNVSMDKRRRYKTRILELHRELMKEDGPDSGLKEAHNVFVQAAIRYIRFEESCKAVQLDLSDVCLPSESTSGSSIQPLDITAETVRMMGKRPNPPTVDALVTHVSGKPPLPEPPRRRKIHRSKPHKGQEHKGQGHKAQGHKGQGHKAQAQEHKGQEHRKHKKSKPIVDVADPNQESARRSKNTEERRQSQKPENKKGAKKIQKS